MTRWRKRVRLAILLSGVAFLVVVVVAIKRRETTAATPDLNRTDPTAVAEITGSDVIQIKGATQDFRVEGGRSLRYPDGRTRIIEGVKLIVDNRAGRTFTVAARDADVAPDQSHVIVKGDVRLTASDGLTALANDASYSRAEGIVRTEGSARFSRGHISGSGVGMTYDETRDVVWILSEAEVQVKEDDKGVEPVKVISGAAGMARRDKYLKFTGGVHVETRNGLMQADEATAYLGRDTERIEMIELRGHSQVGRAESGSGGLKTMRARDINLIYGEDGRTLQRAAMAGAGMIELSADAGQARRLAAEWIDLQLGPDGRTVTGLTSRDNLRLDMPGDRQTPSRRIQAGSLDAEGERGLEHARFRERVEFHEIPVGSSRPRVALARDLDVNFKAGLGALEDAHFIGDVRLEDGDLKASAVDARYNVTTGLMALVGSEGGAGPLPLLTDAQVRIEAPRIDVLLESRSISAHPRVKSVLQPQPGTQAATDGGKRPRFLKSDQTVTATAEKLVFDEKKGRAVYSGNAALWQGDTTVKADSIALDDRTGDLTARGNVRSTLLLEETDEKTKTTRKVPSIAAAQDLHYDDKSRKATYKTGAHVGGPQGDLRADGIELFLSEDGERLERAEAHGHVELRDEKRSATSQRLTYFADDRRYVLSGEPVRIVEECRETTGRTLTFYRSTDRIEVDGNEEMRTQTKGGGKCAGSRP